MIRPLLRYHEAVVAEIVLLYASLFHAFSVYVGKVTIHDGIILRCLKIDRGDKFTVMERS